MQIEEHKILRQMVKLFDFIGLNSALIQASKKDGEILIGAQDASFISKSGKKTPELGFFWNGCEGRY
jgi:hypothetical protein